MTGQECDQTSNNMKDLILKKKKKAIEDVITNEIIFLKGDF